METLAEQARSSLERMIVFNELDSEGMYSEKQLASMLGLGRTPVREALQKLSYDRMVVIHPRRGVQFPKVTVEEQLKLLEVRRGIEPICARFAAIRASEEERLRMRRLARDVVEAADKDDNAAILEKLREINELLVQATRNEYFNQVLSPLQGISRRFWFVNKKHSDTVQGTALHAEVMEAVACKDGDAAEKACSELAEYLTKFVYDTLVLGT